MSADRQAAAQTFHRLHHEGFLVLANAWDAATARLIEGLGAKAIATTSAAVAWSHGYADGDLLPVSLNVLAGVGLPPAAELAALGARRLSAGSGIARAALCRTSVLAEAFVREGRSDPLTAETLPHAQVNALLGAR